jgi:hypothetical protein
MFYLPKVLVLTYGLATNPILTRKLRMNPAPEALETLHGKGNCRVGLWFLKVKENETKRRELGKTGATDRKSRRSVN